MRIRIIAVILLFYALMPGETSLFAQAQEQQNTFSEKIDTLFTTWDNPDVPGAAVLVTQKGKVIYKKCFGLASLEHKAPITDRTVFNLASVSKQFVALAVLLLEKQGKLSLDNDIHDYFSELPDYGVKVNLRHLLHHTSGIWEYSTMFRYYGGFESVDYISKKDILALLKYQDQLLFEPGSQWKYCNTNYFLLGELVARVTGEPLASWSKKNIFEPLKMENTLFRDDYKSVIPRVAGCYYKSDGIYKKNPSNSEAVGPSYLFTTIDDMALWLDNFRLHTVGGDSLIERMFRKSVLNDGSECFYGYGLGVSERDSKTVVGHSGQTGSFISAMTYVRDDEIGVVILANNRSVKAEKLANEILDIYYGKTEQETAPETASTKEPEPFISIDSIDTDGYEGAYTIEDNGGKLLVRRLSSGLYCIFDGFGSDLFYPLSDSVFTNNYRNVTFWMSFDDNHAPAGLTMDLKGDTTRADKVNTPALTPEQLSSTYAGTYYCDALDIAYHIIVNDGRLVIQHRRYSDRPLQPADVDEFVGGIGIVRFSRDQQGAVDGFRVTDEDTNFKPITFRKINY